ncbi:hypothetical protein [Magnetospirillum sp. 15-1]|uniref:hypothetical protein n=1 Tax=Magnetospirillum sp. 15-1 TaxID=1979370 RepID=UPI000BBCD122|nr:hypothetical protein [Magnetospirillum sp. 15-1]
MIGDAAEFLVHEIVENIIHVPSRMANAERAFDALTCLIWSRGPDTTKAGARITALQTVFEPLLDARDEDAPSNAVYMHFTGNGMALRHEEATKVENWLEARGFKREWTI